jgi:lipopolysaccharide transport system permease protein
MQETLPSPKYRKIFLSLLEQRSLVWEFSRRNLESQHRGSVAGLAWMLLNPILVFSVYAFVFMVVFTAKYTEDGRETRFEFALAMFISLQVANFVLDVMQVAPLSIVQQGNYVKKVVFPLEVLPVSHVLAAFVRCILASGLVIGLKVIIGGGVGWTIVWLPVILMLLFIGALGIALGLSAIGVFLRDIVPLVQCLSIILMFTSGVFFSISNLPNGFGFLRWNPLLAAIESSRRVIVWNQVPEAASMGVVAASAIGLYLLGASLFKTLRPAFADVL